jgi:hypothetical protein
MHKQGVEKPRFTPWCAAFVNAHIWKLKGEGAGSFPLSLEP